MHRPKRPDEHFLSFHASSIEQSIEVDGESIDNRTGGETITTVPPIGEVPIPHRIQYQSGEEWDVLPIPPILCPVIGRLYLVSRGHLLPPHE